MVRYNVAAAYIVSAFAALQIAEGFSPSPLLPVIPRVAHENPDLEHRSGRTRRNVGASWNDGGSGNGDTDDGRSSSTRNSLQEALKTSGASFPDILSSVKALATDDDEVDPFELATERKRKVVREREGRVSSTTFEVTVPIAKSTSATQTTEKATSDAASVASAVGVSLRQVGNDGRLSELALSLDDMRMKDVNAEMREAKSTGREVETGSVQYLDSSMMDGLDEKFRGVIVSSVVRGGLAWEGGVRAGDALLATSATLGEKLWPKSTLDGVRSAISSRKITTPVVTLQFRRTSSRIATSEVVEEFELSLARPMGFQVEESEAGQVVICGFTDDKTEVENSLKVGDRVVAVESSLGGRMWPVSSVDGLVSACTARIPGQRVKIRFQRVVEVGEWEEKQTSASTGGAVAGMEQPAAMADMASVAPSLTGAVDGFRRLKTDVAESAIQSTGSNTHKLLLSRCRDVLRRYTEEQPDEKFAAKYSVPVLVADRVLEALADASAPLDGKTLSLVMNAYLSCKKPESAVRAFEAAVGLAADGTWETPDVVIEGKVTGSRIVADVGALSLFTGTALLRAHALSGNYMAAQRVLTAMEGRSGVEVGGAEVALWPGTGSGGSLTPDARCYNVVMDAAAKAGGMRGVETAIEVFDMLAEPNSRNNADRPEKTVVSYNTLIAAFAKAGRSQDAFSVFYSMKQARVKPDKFTYTTLIKACVHDGDVRELLYDMKEEGIKADVVTYNTVMEVLCDRCRWYEARELVTEMESGGVKPNAITYGLLMSGLLKAGKPGPCLTLFETACADERTAALTESVQLYTTAVTAASTMGDHERALDLVSRMNLRGIKPNLKTLTALVGGCLTGGKEEYAVEVYKKIDQPDGYAMTIGMRAFCAAGDFGAAADLLTQQRDGYKKMSGKQIMASYNCLISAALEQNEFGVAREAFTQMLQSSYIPSKVTFKSILEGLDLLPKGRKGQFARQARVQSQDTEKFDFLVFVLDAIDRRKLPCDGFFYSSVVFEGARLGGLRKKIASLLVNARARTIAEGDKIDTGEDDCDVEQCRTNWEALVEHYDEFKSKLGQEILLPALRVRVNMKESRQVLAAERAVSYGARRMAAAGRR